MVVLLLGSSYHILCSQFYMVQGILAHTLVTASVLEQRQLQRPGRKDGCAKEDGSFPPANEDTLMRFASLLADNLNYSSIKVYFSAVRSLHIDCGLSDPLVNCLRLQHLLGGIKRVQGPASPSRLPITVDLLQAIHFKVHIKCSKTDPFCVGCDIYVGRGVGSVCPVTALGS